MRLTSELKPLAVAVCMTAAVMGLYSALKDNMAHNAAITTATLAEITARHYPIFVNNVRGDSKLLETYYSRPTDEMINDDYCFLAIDGKAVPNTCYQK